MTPTDNNTAINSQERSNNTVANHTYPYLDTQNAVEDTNIINIHRREVRAKLIDEIKLDYYFDEENILSAREYIANLDYELTTKRDSLKILEFFLKINKLAKKESRHLFRITNNQIEFANKIFTINNIILDYTKMTNINDLAVYAMEIINRYDDIGKDKEFIEEQLKIIFMLMEKYIVDDQNKSTQYETFNTIVTQGYLLAFTVTKKLNQAFNFLIDSTYLSGDVNLSLKQIPHILSEYNFKNSDDNLIACAIANTSKHMVKRLLENGANVSNQILLQAMRILPFSNIEYRETIPSNYSIVISLLEYIEEDTLEEFPQEYLIYFFIPTTEYNVPCTIIDDIIEQKIEEYGDDISKPLDELISNKIKQLLHATNMENTPQKYYENMLKSLANYKKYNVLTKIQVQKIIFMYLQKITTSPIKKDQEISSDILINALIEINDLIGNSDYADKFTTEYNLALIKLIFLAINNYTDKTLTKGVEAILGNSLAKSIYHKYLMLPKTQRLLENNEFSGVFGDMDGNVDWTDNQSYNYVMIVKDLVLCLSHKQIRQFSFIEDDTQAVNWNNLFIFNSEGINQTTAKYDLNDIFTNYFVIFAENFIVHNSQSIRHKFIQSLSLDKYEELFITAQNYGYNEVKLVEDIGKISNNDKLDDDYTLLEILIKNIDIQNNNIIGITTNHLNTIKTIFNLTNKSPKEVAMHLLCLSYLFVKYSSQSIFGTEDSSPNSLRMLGYAYMQAAYYNDKTLFDRILNNGEIISEFEGWKNQLLPENNTNSNRGTYGCTGMLSLTMIDRIKAHCPIKTLHTLIPLAWQ